jgi:hypothetical protein
MNDPRITIMAEALRQVHMVGSSTESRERRYWVYRHAGVDFYYASASEYDALDRAAVEAARSQELGGRVPPARPGAPMGHAFR